MALGPTHRLHCSSLLGLPYRILNRNHKKEQQWSLWVGFQCLPGFAAGHCFVSLRTNLEYARVLSTDMIYTITEPVGLSPYHVNERTLDAI